jgi:endonuclease III
MELTARQSRALEMRVSGKKLREIGAELDITTSRARQLIARAQMIQRQSDWAEGLPSRYVAALLARGINSRSMLEAAMADGSLGNLPGIGKKCFATITVWLSR